MKINIPIEPEVRAKASSRYDRETIERRLKTLEHIEGPDAERERQYLKQLVDKVE